MTAIDSTALELLFLKARTHNAWTDRATWETVNSVEDKDSPLVGINPAELGPAAAGHPAKTGRSPRASTVSSDADHPAM